MKSVSPVLARDINKQSLKDREDPKNVDDLIDPLLIAKKGREIIDNPDLIAEGGVFN